MSVRVVTPRDWIAQPWQNGRGITQEVMRWSSAFVPISSADPDYAVRVSLAEVTTSGPFSRFPGLRRTTVHAGGARIELVTPAGTHGLEPGALVELAGEAALAARVFGPAHLLNILARPATVDVGVGVPAHPIDFVFALADVPELPRWHARVCAPPAPFAGACVWLRLRRGAGAG